LDWFERLTGFRENGYAEAQARLQVDGERLMSRVNGQSYGVGRLEVLSLGELRQKLKVTAPGRLRVSNVSADVKALHRAPENRGALFQVASQFNLLEMIGPAITPEHGVTRYASDPTQGPACAIAAGAATLYRNYFAPVEGQVGQTATRQIDGSAALRETLAEAVGLAPDALWTMQNGYALPSEAGLKAVATFLRGAEPATKDALRATLCIGLHWDVEVTDQGSPEQIVSQAFCSAMPVSYSGLAPAAWAPLAQLVLEAAYDATLAGALLAGRGASQRRVFLTRLGGGAFGNEPAWIDQALRRALRRFQDANLDVRLVSYGTIAPTMRALESEFAAEY